MRAAERHAASTRRNSVRMPRNNSHASNEPMVPPICARTIFTRFQYSESSRVTNAPAITSECPFRYLVAECMTMSAPSVSGRVSTGDAAVESTASNAPAVWAISAAAAISVMVQSGLAGVSIHTRRVLPGCMARRNWFRSCTSINSTCSPQCVAKFINQLRNDQYITFGAMT